MANFATKFIPVPKVAAHFGVQRATARNWFEPLNEGVVRRPRGKGLHQGPTLYVREDVVRRVLSQIGYDREEVEQLLSQHLADVDARLRAQAERAQRVREEARQKRASKVAPSSKRAKHATASRRSKNGRRR